MLAIGTAFLVSSCIVGFFRWWVFVKGNQVSFKTVWTLSWAGCFVNTCVPGGVGGDLMRGILLGGRFTKAQGLASVAADRGIAIVALVVLNGVFLITDSSTLQAAAHYRWAAIFFVALSVLMALVVLVGPKLNKGLKTWLAPWKGQGWRWGGGLALALLGHVLTCVGLIFYLKALPGVQPELSRYLSHLPLALALAGIPALPGGLGIGHLAFAGILGLAGAERAADLYTLYVIFLFVVQYRIALVIPALVADAWYAPVRDFSMHTNKMLLLAVGMVLIFTAVVRTTRISQRYGLEKK
jgi:uncharacterized membrane protein YbhN (UPF0104 family)